MLLNICAFIYRELHDSTVILEKLTIVTQVSLEAYKKIMFFLLSFVYIGCVILPYKM